MVGTDIRQALVDELSEHLRTEIDREVLWGLLQESGWTRVELPSYFRSNNHAIEVRLWLEEHIKKHHLSSGAKFLFEDSKEATMFILRWYD